MILADTTIHRLLLSGELIIEPITDRSIQPASVDLRIGESFSVPKVSCFVEELLNASQAFEERTDRGILISPNSFILATTIERIKLPPNVAGMISGRSSVGRQGLFVENAGYVDPGFDGHITLELYNAGPNSLWIEAGTRVAQLILHDMDRPTANPYSGKYNGQTGATTSRMDEDKERMGDDTEQMTDTDAETEHDAEHDRIHGTYAPGRYA